MISVRVDTPRKFLCGVLTPKNFTLYFFRLNDSKRWTIIIIWMCLLVVIYGECNRTSEVESFVKAVHIQKVGKIIYLINE